jgi:hypothetical protein
MRQEGLTIFELTPLRHTKLKTSPMSQAHPTTLQAQPLPESSTAHHHSTMIPQSDGANESKPMASPPPRPNLRKRLAKILSKKKPDADLDDYNGDVEIPEPSPMRVLSPRAIQADLSTPKSKKVRSITFRNRPGKSVKMGSIGGMMSEGEKQKGKEREGVRGSSGHVPVTDVPTAQTSLLSALRDDTPLREEEVEAAENMTPSMPASPSRDAALTSHPVPDKGRSQGSIVRFETPAKEAKDSLVEL